jgi:hypothetical protein
MRSPLFTLRVVEIADLPEDSPLDSQAITDLAAVSLGRWNLFSIDLSPIEARLRTNPWIREVRLQKRFPQTLAINVVFRQPRALHQDAHGKLSYIDEDGHVFGQVSLSRQPDLPLVSGVPASAGDRIQEALRLIDSWEKADVGRISQLASLEFDGERGFRAWVTYPLLQPKGGGLSGNGRVVVELGQEIDLEQDGRLGRLQSVFRYLSSNGISARQIWADAGKKIVVKIARGS